MLWYMNFKRRSDELKKIDYSYNIQESGQQEMWELQMNFIDNKAISMVNQMIESIEAVHLQIDQKLYESRKC